MKMKLWDVYISKSRIDTFPFFEWRNAKFVKNHLIENFGFSAKISVKERES